MTRISRIKEKNPCHPLSKPKISFMGLANFKKKLAYFKTGQFLASALIGLSALIAVNLLTSSRNRYPVTPSPKPNPPSAVRVDGLCGRLPKPQDFTFVDKQFSDNVGRDFAIVVYRFATGRSQQEIFPAFILWFNENGWQTTSEDNVVLEFEKYDQTITIFQDQEANSNYKIVCAEAATTLKVNDNSK